MCSEISTWLQCQAFSTKTDFPQIVSKTCEGQAETQTISIEKISSDDGKQFQPVEDQYSSKTSRGSKEANSRLWTVD